MRLAPRGSFGAHPKSLREAAGFTQEELATIAGLSVHAVSALDLGPDQWAQSYAQGPTASSDAMLEDIDRALGPDAADGIKPSATAL